ncbi:MAG: hypothetical protein LBR06_06020 [Bacteroidales bacterium]|jgi:hypothetical protein|nr:hypothetical protein [Bacteroidales bacterium]
MNKTFGAGIDRENIAGKRIIRYINLKLAALGYPCYHDGRTEEFLEIAAPLLSNYKEQSRQLSNCLAPIGYRLQRFVNTFLKGHLDEPLTVMPRNAFNLDRHGLARIMSLPPGANSYRTDMVTTYRTAQGILHNPKSDKRTTKGVFHICEGGFPVPSDKKAVPKAVFARLLRAALNPPRELLKLPFTHGQPEEAALFVSLLLRPTVVPEVEGIIREKSMEVCFLAPGSLIGNLDFTESVFGNAGNPYLPENDAALDPDGWTGHTGLVLLATHLISLTKKELGLPHWDEASPRQRNEGMCWRTDTERYNEGQPFKITARDPSGVAITIIADNYFGYCKKEVKTFISFSANLYGLAEEEHAGGALAFPTFDLGERFHADDRVLKNGLNFNSLAAMYPDMMDVQPEGYGIDRRFPHILYVPDDAEFNVFDQRVSWAGNNGRQSVRLAPEFVYVLPAGYKVRMRKRLNGQRWHLTGTVAEGTLCHKPCTVSGGGKSEISKSIIDAMIQGPVYVANLTEELDRVAEILDMDFSKRLKNPPVYTPDRPSRKILDTRRTLGSVIKLLNPSDEYTDEYNEWLRSVPQNIKDLIYIVKRRHHPETGDWRSMFSVDKVNGADGNELKYQGKKLIANYLRVGHDLDQSWRIFKVRQDYFPAEKVQVEDDITASVVLSATHFEGLNPACDNPSVKMLTNCEARLFQRPDDAIIKGYDKQAEKDIATPNTFLSNFEPLTKEAVHKIKDDTIGFDYYTQPMKDLINSFLADADAEYLVVSSEPRIVNGKPSANPRYLQVRPDWTNPADRYLAETATRFFRKLPPEQPLYLPVNVALPGRRNNPADPANNVPPLAVYNPIHYQELPELFIEFICSVTGKSPSTTGFGSEGALTKGPFNNLPVAFDLNNAFLSYILTGYEPLSSVAGYIGPNYKVAHDISLLMPEVISRMSVEERRPQYLIERGFLEKVENFEYKGELVEASLLGYRITLKFATYFLGRIFNNPEAVFTPEMLRPETQDMDTFVQSMRNLAVTQKRVAEGLIADGTFELLCPPLQALVKLMVDGHFEGMKREDPDFRRMFTREAVLSDDWYRRRLIARQQREIDFQNTSIAYIESALANPNYAETAQALDLAGRLRNARTRLARVSSPEYINELWGTIGGIEGLNRLV